MSDADARPPRTTEPTSVVLVEDHRGMREMVAETLAGAGFRVLDTAATVRGARESIVRHLPRVAVIDNRLPDGLGVDLCRTLSRETPSVALLIYTTDLTPAGTREALDAGVDAVVLKSIHAQPLIDALRGLVAGRGPLAPGRGPGHR